MINYSVPFIIMLINIVIVVLLINYVHKYKRKRQISPFNNVLYNMARLLLIANTFALITAFLDYFVYHSTTLDILQFGRFADRYVMVYAYLCITEFED